MSGQDFRRLIQEDEGEEWERECRDCGNQYLASGLTILSFVLLGKFIWDEFGHIFSSSKDEKLSHRQRVNLERLANQLYAPEKSRG